MGETCGQSYCPQFAAFFVVIESRRDELLSKNDLARWAKVAQKWAKVAHKWAKSGPTWPKRGDGL